MKKKNYKLVVIGGGISGLGFAHLAGQGEDSLLLEAADRVGGCINGHSFFTGEGDFWAELGAHTCYNSYGNLLQILEDTEQLRTLQPKERLSYKIHTTSGLSSIFSQFNLLELAGVLPRLWLSKKNGRSVSDYYGAVIGKRNFRNVLGPALDAVICQPAGDFPAESLFIKKPRRKEIMRSFTGPSGLQSFIDGIANQSGIEIRTESPATGLERTESGFLVSTGGGTIHTDYLVIAAGPDIAARLLQNSFPDLAGLLSKIEMTSTESMAVLLEKDALELPPIAGIIGREDEFYSAVSRDLVPDAKHRAFTFHFRPGRLSESEKIRCICDVLGVNEAKVIDHASTINRLPSLKLGHQQLVEQVDEQLSGTTLGLTGNWFSGVSIEDSLVRTKSEYLRLFQSV